MKKNPPSKQQIAQAKKLLSAAMGTISRMRKTHKGGRPPLTPDRCPCGLYSRGRADKRRHKCNPGDEPVVRHGKRGRPRKVEV